MKTPEEMAEEYCEDHDECEFAYEAFIAGYQAAKDAYKDAISVYEDVAKQMLEEAVRIMSPKDQLADAGKVMNSPEKPDSCDFIVDVSKMVNIKLRQACDDMLEVLSPVTQAPISDYIEHLEKIAVGNTSNNSNGWISVKDSLPEYTPMVLAMCTDGYELAYYGMYGQGWSNTLGTEHLNVTHWMPLPEPPKEEK